MTISEAIHISVVIPLFNKQYSIDECLKSVIRQTIRAFEIIVVDDGSIDNGREVAERVLSETDIPYRIFFQENCGVSCARNLGARYASGKYIAFLDADDVWNSDYLANMIDLILVFPECSLFSCSHRVNENGVVRECACKIARTGEMLLMKDYLEYFAHANIINSSKVIIEKEAFWSAGGFPEGVTTNEDLFLWIKLAENYGLAYFQKVLVTINKFEDKSRAERVGKIPYIIDYYSRNKYEVRRVRGLDRFVWRVCYSHFISEISNSVDNSVARKMMLAIFSIFPFKSLLLIPIFVVPQNFLKFLIRLRKK